MEESTPVRWIEIDPGAPLLAEVPPWAVRYELVKRPGLPETVRKAIQGTGVALMAGAIATAVLVGGGAGYADLYAGIAAILGMVLLFFGLIGLLPSETYVPAPGGRYVAVEIAPAPADPSDIEWMWQSDRRVTRAVRFAGALLGISIMLAVLMGEFTYSSVERLAPLLVVLLPGLVGTVMKAIQRRMKSEAGVSDRFLQAADPRVPLIAPGVPASASAAAPSTEREPSTPSPSV